MYCENEVHEAAERFGIRAENDLHFDIDENPLFVDPTPGDYRIREDVVGFGTIPFEKIGRFSRAEYSRSHTVRRSPHGVTAIKPRYVPEYES